MKQARKRLTYANVMSTIGIFLVLGGATAFAASQLGKNSVGSKQLKKNSVTAAKIKKNAVTKAKIKNGAVDGAKIADGSITGTEINAGSTSFSQIVARIRGTATVPVTSGQIYPFSNPTYTQNTNEDNQYLASVDFSFPASCTPPRIAQALLLIDSPNPAAPSPLDIAGLAVVQDTVGGAVTRRTDFGPYPGGYQSMNRIAPTSSTPHTFTIYLAGFSCNTGSGVTATGAGVDVIGTK